MEYRVADSSSLSSYIYTQLRGFCRSRDTQARPECQQNLISRVVVTVSTERKVRYICVIPSNCKRFMVRLQ